MNRQWRTPAAVAAVVAAVLMAGCAAVPTSGPVRQGPTLADDSPALLYRAIPQPPRPGMGPAAVVQGFLAATTSSSDAYQVAQQYLTPDAAASWEPVSTVRVYDTTGLQTTAAGDRVEVAGVLDGTIDGSGAYQPAHRGEALRVTYRMVKVDGQWRIADLPQGLVIGRGDVDREFRSYPVYFFDPTYSVVVPDLVTVSVASRAGLSTTLVRSLLAGPTSWLAPAVRTAFPEGTTLALATVPVDQGVAHVDLTSQVLAADDASRAALSAQLVWTLRAVPGVTAVAVTVNGQPLTVPGAAIVQPVDQWSGVDPDGALPPDPTLYAVSGGALVQADGAGRVAPVPGPFGTGEPAVTKPAVSADGSQVAVLSADRRELWLAGTVGTAAPRRLVAGAADLSRPSFDREGGIWVVDRGGRGLLRVVGGVADPVPLVNLPDGVTGSSVVAVAVSPDSTRVALLVRRGGRVEPWVARVERDGSSLRLAAPRRADSEVVHALDLAWAGSESLVVLGLDTTGRSTLFTLAPQLPRVDALAAPDGSTEVAAAPGGRIALAADGELRLRDGTDWFAVGAGGSPAYAG